MEEPEISDEELDARMRRNLFKNDEIERAGLSAADLRIAERLLGRDNARNLDRAKKSDTRFRYRRPDHVCEYYCHPGILFPFESWTINLIENGFRRTFKEGLTEEQCFFVIRAIRAKGVPVRELETEFMRLRKIERAAASEMHQHGRKSFADRYGDFTVAGGRQWS
jgi:hypothetical protein